MQRSQSLIAGIVLAMVGSVLFSGKAVVVKLAYRYGVDAATLIALRMLFAAMVGPVSTILLAFVFLGEGLSIWQAFGTVLVLAGVLILTRVRTA